MNGFVFRKGKSRKHNLSMKPLNCSCEILRRHFLQSHMNFTHKTLLDIFFFHFDIWNTEYYVNFEFVNSQILFIIIFDPLWIWKLTIVMMFHLKYFPNFIYWHMMVDLKSKKKYASQIDMLMPNWLLKLNSHLLNQESSHYSCSNLTTTWIQISRQNRNDIFSNISHQIMV